MSIVAPSCYFFQAGFFKFIAVAAFLVVTTAPLSTQVKAQQGKPADAKVDPKIEEGRGLFMQRCEVCHSTVRKVYGPQLTKNVVTDREEEVRQQIQQGSAMMPGFQFGLKDSQIDLIIGYLKTVTPPSKRVGANGEDLPD